VKVLAIVTTALLRFGREKFNLFFVFVLPLAIVLLIGLQYGEAPTPKLGVVADDGDAVAAELIDRLDGDDLEVVRFDSADALLEAVDAGDVGAGLDLPGNFGESVGAGDPVQVGFVSSAFGLGPQLEAMVDDALARTLAVPTAIQAATSRGADEAAARSAATDQLGIIDLIEVSTITTGDRLFPEDLSGFEVGAAGQLVLFMFLTSLTGSAAIIQSRRLGVASRMMSTPTSVGTILAGEAAARFAIAVAQGVYIMMATVLLFGVNWGNLVASATILAVFGLVGAAAAMLSGATFQNDEQASGITVVLALALGALGGSMLPIELFSDTMLTIAKAIPHYWALDAFAEVVRRDGTVVDILAQLGILVGFAAAIGVVAVWRMRRTLTRP
jgi:ABC-2 type transport system permease protein